MSAKEKKRKSSRTHRVDIVSYTVIIRSTACTPRPSAEEAEKRLSRAEWNFSKDIQLFSVVWP